MKKITRLLVLALLSGGGWFGYQHWENQRGGEQSTQDLTLFGNVEIHQVELAFRVGGRILDMPVSEGAVVEQGVLLALLDPVPFENGLRLAAANVAAQEAGLNKAMNGFRQEEVAQVQAVLLEREATVNNMRQSLERIRKLRGSGGISQQNLEDAQARYDESVARLDAARKQLALFQSGTRVEDIAAQQAALDAARVQADIASMALEDSRLLAPQAGTVLTRTKETGAIVQPGQTVFILTLTDPVHIRAYVPQPSLGLIKPGDRVTISVDAMPDKHYQGTVGYISPMAEFTPKSVETREVRNDLVFRLRIIAADPDNIMRQGMPVTIKLPRETYGP